MNDNNNYGKGYFDEGDQGSKSILSRGLTGVFALMFLGLLTSAASAFLTLSSPLMANLVFGSEMGFFAFLIAPLLLVMFAFPRVWKLSAGAALSIFFLYAFLNGLTLAVIFLAYDLGTITLAFGSAAIMFGTMAVYGAVTKADLSGFGSMLFMGLIGIIAASVLNWFFASSALDTIISYAGVVVFLGLTAYDTQKIKVQMDEHGNHAGIMVLGALHLYLDFLNIFLFLLRLFGRRR